ncbi:MAG: hypothetical protein ACHBN1_29010 [Heteroscytonema crispum UTEX LB 1556]
MLQPTYELRVIPVKTPLHPWESLSVLSWRFNARVTQHLHSCMLGYDCLRQPTIYYDLLQFIELAISNFN